MKEQNKKEEGKNTKKIATLNKKRIIIYIVVIAILLYILYTIYLLIKQPTGVFTIEEGKLYQEETDIGYVIRDEKVAKGENYKNGMEPIKSEGERAAFNENIFRYYSNNEESLKQKIAELDTKIQEAMTNDTSLFNSDMKLIENQIDEKVQEINKITDVSKLTEYKKEIDTLVTKKAKIAGDLSPKGSYLNGLIEERKEYESKLNSGAEYVKAPISGVVSYRVDGFEEILTTKDFGSISKEFLEGLNLKTGQIVAANNESGKIINNYECYIATVLNSEYAKQAEVGKSVKLRLPSGNEVSAEIEYINMQEDDYVLIFKIEKSVEELISYRKISFDVIWWSESGKKIPNSAIKYEEKGDNKVAYVIRTRAGYQDKIWIKELRTNGKYTIVEDYTSEELKELGYTSEEIKARKKISLYDEILINS